MNKQALDGYKISVMHYSCPPVIGGVEFMVEAHVRWLNKYGASVEMITGEGEQFEEEVPIREFPELASDYPEKEQVREELAQGNLELFEEKKELCKEKVAAALEGTDLTLVHNVFTMSFNLPFTAAVVELAGSGRFNLVPWTHDIAWIDDKYETPDKYPWNLLASPAEVEKYVAISGLRADQLKDTLGAETPVEVIHDGIEFNEFHELDPKIKEIYRDREMYYDDILAIFPARIVRRKNFELALEIIYHLKKLGYSLHLIITGPPDPHNPEIMEYFEELKELRAELDLEEEVIFCYELEDPETGEPLKISYNRMRQFYRLSDVLLFTTLQEGFGLPLLEAGLSRTLICCSNIEPLREVGGEAPLYFDPEEHPSIIAYEIKEEIESQAATRLQRRVRKNFTWPAIFERKIIPFLKETLSGPD